DEGAAASGGSKPAAQDKVLSASANLAQLLPTGSVMAYQALSSSFNNHGECYTSNWWLTVSLVSFLTVFCVFFAFTDSIHHNGKVYYGVAMSGGLRIFNGDDDSKFAIAHEKNIRNEQSQKEATTLTGWRSISRRNAQKVTDSTAAAVPVKPNDLTLRPEEIRAIQALTGELKKRKLHWLDGVHAFFTAVVFLSVAFSDVGLQKCLFPHAGRDTMELLKNMPLGMSFLSSFVFMIFPTTRHGIGFHGSDNSTSSEVGGPKPEGENKIDSAMAVYLKKEEEKKMNSSVVIEVETEEEDEISSSDVPGSNASSRTVADPEDIKAPRLAVKFYQP
ncbi:protein DMP3-like, partial [Oryza brachyantha]|uniref:protein DMP3-like n=1 Tax=Oryza brachyantha TaxID=4533 RepID=UPI001ADA8765